MFVTLSIVITLFYVKKAFEFSNYDFLRENLHFHKLIFYLINHFLNFLLSHNSFEPFHPIVFSFKIFESNLVILSAGFLTVLMEFHKLRLTLLGTKIA